MNRVSHALSLRKGLLGAATIGVLGLAGCDRNEVTVYEIPKEPAPEPLLSSSGPAQDPHAGTAAIRPSLSWGDLPEGWTEEAQSSGMRLATFSVAAGGEKVAEMAIIPMGGFAGKEAQLVNMWRQQLGLPELAASEAGGQGESVVIGGADGRMYEMVGETQKGPTRMLVASATKDGVNFFFKLIGEDVVVSGQKDVFLSFLKGVEFTSPPPATAPPSLSASDVPAGEKRWEALAGWEEQPPTQFLLAKYRVPGEGGLDAEVTVSRLGGSAGGLLPNVNRWRGQLNLEPVDDAGLTDLMSVIKAGTVDATLITLEGTDRKSGTPARMLAAVVSLPTETWFFKMTGAIPAVEAKTDEFRAFVNKAQF